MSSIWLLEAKAFPEDPRSSTATTAKFWLTPGTFSVGRLAGQCDIDVVEDKSISRNHATITVPSIQEWTDHDPENQPFVTITDTSRYGTLVTKDNNLGAPGSTNQETRAYDHFFVRFGYSSPFRLINQAIALRMHPTVPQEMRDQAVAMGLPLTDDCSQDEGGRLIMAGATAKADGAILHALLHQRSVVAATWVSEWASKKVWKNNRPPEASHPVAITYISKQGNQKSLSGTQALLAASEDQFMKGVELLWTAGARDEDLQLVVEEAGASNQDCPATAAKATHAPAHGAVVVKSQGDPVPAHMTHHPVTTHQLLIAGLLEGSLEGVFIQPSSPEPTSKKKGAAVKGGKKAAAGKGSTPAKAPAPDDGDETTDDEAGLAPPAHKVIEDDDDVEDQPAAGVQPQGRATRTRATPAKAATPATATRAGKRKAASAASSPTKQQQGKEEATPALAKKQKTASSTKAAAVGNVLPSTMKRVPPAGDVMSPQEGWKSTHNPVKQEEHHEEDEQQPKTEDKQPESEPQQDPESPLAPPAPPIVDRSKDSKVSVANLVVVKPDAGRYLDDGQGHSDGYSGPNFKAFRRKGTHHGAVAASYVPVYSAPAIPYKAEPYREQQVLGGEEYAREERERERQQDAAEDLFNAKLKAKKAPPLPAGTNDSPPGGAGAAAGGRGRGRGRGKA